MNVICVHCSRIFQRIQNGRRHSTPCCDLSQQLIVINTESILMPRRLHQDTCRPETCIPDEQHVSGYIYVAGDTCRRIQVARSGYMLTASRRHNYYSFLSRSTCIPLYPATDGQQTGDNFVADTRHMLTTTSGYNLNPAMSWCKRGIIVAYCSQTHTYSASADLQLCVDSSPPSAHLVFTVVVR